MQYLMFIVKIVNYYLYLTINIQVLVRFCVDHRIKPHVPPFEQIPANSVKFQPCDCTPQAEYLRVSLNLIQI